ncbi:hypothetical protein CEUSTIGMA_g9315.t1 [Chlamydomonas eustigma]|uniref:peptidylprolyl isomerase n=1 Tax=Chlamydomonas eustigma TaxID=1157962 RepID=A0A250XFP2_9CHLO|nr:hypothetical protein CEUSTIGMA_g9315.t1 [Chlamydomonas eustigma]|eukprot:GAX81887.1 hypothetical protein CEUSTIGMA_g9315.t1 [Chlamydomonas eustigma]
MHVRSTNIASTSERFFSKPAAYRCVSPPQSTQRSHGDNLETSRRFLLSTLPLISIPLDLASYAPASHAASSVSPGEWSSPGLAVPEDPNAPKFVRTVSGVKIQELSQGSGSLFAEPGDLVLFDYILRRSNGYFIYGTVEGVSFQPRDVPIGPVAHRLGAGQMLPGLEEVLTGMKQGGKRRALIPPSVGYEAVESAGSRGSCSVAEPQPPTFATKRQLLNHCKEPLMFEVEVRRINKS